MVLVRRGELTLCSKEENQGKYLLPVAVNFESFLRRVE